MLTYYSNTLSFSLGLDLDDVCSYTFLVNAIELREFVLCANLEISYTEVRYYNRVVDFKDKKRRMLLSSSRVASSRIYRFVELKQA